MGYPTEIVDPDIGSIDLQQPFHEPELPFCSQNSLLPDNPGTPPSPASTLSTDTTSATTDSMLPLGSELSSSQIESQPSNRIPYPLPNFQEALELRFAQRSLTGGAGTGITLTDMEKGRSLFASGLTNVRLPDDALHEAVLMKEAGRETRRLRAMASAWELKEVEHYQKLLRHIYKREVVNLHIFDTYIGDIQHLTDLIQFKHHEYTEELTSMLTSDIQFSVLEKETQERFRTRVSCSGKNAVPSSAKFTASTGGLGADWLPQQPSA